MTYLPENEPTIELSVPCDEVNILIDCIPKYFERTSLLIAVGKSTLTIVRSDEYPIQVRRLSRKQPLSYGMIGLERPLDFLTLDYDAEDGEWYVPNDVPVKDFDTMDTFAMLITGYAKGKLSKKLETPKHIA